MIPNGVEQDIISRPHLSSFFSFEFDIGDSVVLLTIYEMLSLQAEQNAIRRQNDEANQPLSWSQIRNMPLSSKVWAKTLKKRGKKKRKKRKKRKKKKR